jgi:hypothetical protein
MPSNAARAIDDETETDTVSEPVTRREMMPQPHGGSLQRGGLDGGGNGPPPSALRDSMRQSIAERYSVIEAIMDGQVVQKTRVSVYHLAPMCVCDACGNLEIRPAPGKRWRELECQVSATPKDRIAAFEIFARYGMGQLREISVENVRERLGNTLNVIRSQLPKEQAEALILALQPVWR